MSKEFDDMILYGNLRRLGLVKEEERTLKEEDHSIDRIHESDGEAFRRLTQQPQEGSKPLENIIGVDIMEVDEENKFVSVSIDPKLFFNPQVSNKKETLSKV